MSSNQDQILQLYSGGGEEGRVAKSRSISLEFHYTEKLLRDFIGSDSRVVELGCGTGYYGMRLADRCASYTGVDLTPDNVAAELADRMSESRSCAGLANHALLIGRKDVQKA